MKYKVLTMDKLGLIITFGIVAALIAVWINFIKNRNTLREKLAKMFPKAWEEALKLHVRFYAQLNPKDKELFNKRIQLFLATKNVVAVETEIDDTIRLMVASSAIIPTFAFPEYNYPNVNTVLIYPNSFDENFQTKRFEGHKEYISGMVGNRFMNGTVILSKPDLVKSFDGQSHNENVGIHEFVHLLDKQDGAIDGIPELLMYHSYVAPWLHEIKNEIDRIEKGQSDINPYALTNNAEFLAVVSEYFLGNPEYFKSKHNDLYNYLVAIFHKPLK